MVSTDKALVLIVDDNETGLYSKTRILRQAGFEVIQASTGTDALRAVVERSPRLVVLDVKLPDVNGWEVCRRIKADPATSSVLVLQLSATYVHEADTVRALEGGADACLTEPVEPPVLVATVRALLRTRQAEDELRDALAREQEARNAAEIANRAKDEFLATLSHELRSPLGAILTWVTLMRAGRLDPARTGRALEAIERNTRLQVKLVEDLLDVSRIVTGKMNLDVRLVDLATVIDAALDTVRPAAEAKLVRLDTLLDRRIGPILGDADRLQQVLWNLLANAIKFTPREGGIEIRLDALESQARISVRDTGRGIDRDLLPHVFERFRQADTSITRSDAGLGLGLAIVRHLVELHGGTVQAESPGQGEGATFTILLPLPAIRTVEDEGPRGTHHEMARLDLPMLRDVRVLVVDDERDARDAVVAILEHAGATVASVTSVREALAQMESSAPDVLVSDIAMPGEDGYELIRRIRDRAPELGPRVPTLALTAHAGVNDQKRVLAAGFHAYLAKPIEPGELVSMIASLAGRSGKI